mmetsp:Transcript_7975/g.19056  ORF Transcript_7975/g.19056 Transcript_7975/m.19056 type:complete len:247 (-) Transcript_7975:158-898(-)
MGHLGHLHRLWTDGVRRLWAAHRRHRDAQPAEALDDDPDDPLGLHRPRLHVPRHDGPRLRDHRAQPRGEGVVREECLPAQLCLRVPLHPSVRRLRRRVCGGVRPGLWRLHLPHRLALLRAPRLCSPLGVPPRPLQGRPAVVEEARGHVADCLWHRGRRVWDVGLGVEHVLVNRNPATPLRLLGSPLRSREGGKGRGKRAHERHPRASLGLAGGVEGEPQRDPRAAAAHDTGSGKMPVRGPRIRAPC